MIFRQSLMFLSLKLWSEALLRDDTYSGAHDDADADNYRQFMIALACRELMC